MSSIERDQVIEQVDEQRTRRQLLTAGGAAALTGLLGVLGLSSVAAAKNGDAIRAGEKTAATKTTTLEGKKGPRGGGADGGGRRRPQAHGRGPSIDIEP